MILERLQGHIPDAIYQQIPGVLPMGIDGPKRLSHLLGESAHESGNFTKFTENLNYSAQGLANTWPSRYAVDPKAGTKIPNALAYTLEHKPEAIANNCYANRNGNGPESTGDGYLYRGRGCLQTTGKSNYKLLGEALGVDLLTHPELVATQYQLASAAFFFKSNGLWTICDKGVDDNTCAIIGERINGGTLGAKQRRELTQLYYSILTS